MKNARLLIIGYGTMTHAMLEGWLASGIDPDTITLYNPRPKPAPAGITLVTALPVEAPDLLVLGFKPGKLAEVAPEIRHLAGPDTLIVSVLAGTTLHTLRGAFPDARGVVRMIPNLAAALRRSITGLFASALSDDWRNRITELAEALGRAEWLASEDDFNLVAALTSSGPAFVYRFIDALSDGAAGLGLERTQAQRMALAMVEGASLLAAHSDDSPAQLAQQVASPGGMTERGLAVLDEGAALARVVAETLRAARDRAQEMSAANPLNG